MNLIDYREYINYLKSIDFVIIDTFQSKVLSEPKNLYIFWNEKYSILIVFENEINIISYGNIYFNYKPYVINLYELYDNIRHDYYMVQNNILICAVNLDNIQYNLKSFINILCTKGFFQIYWKESLADINFFYESSFINKNYIKNEYNDNNYKSKLYQLPYSVREKICALTQNETRCKKIKNIYEI